ncbi:hypothetical protein GCM10010168_91790 [Actinoplanes ianthinogenes]|uniref:Uncharacterized protein n=1 Tax=Actinoplanes ianthinogenes TaxID=122358 RepID=A0ABM7LND7_9ACTN|nr:hypothetical protein [Actinoplanes ianthinogenes]BCJ40797.1 hypothetical protein Aiant_14540 [Actinoplanes ianthinogenes]GGR58512.1 hypothetical protein GCM10010168_91790 [Actinoplanes ianthinogenes]
MEYPVVLALEDFVPVIVGFLGFALLGRMGPAKAARRAGVAGAVLIGLGGTAKCAWKLVYASGGGDLAVLEQSLFPLMAAGACLLSWSLAVTIRRGGRTQIWPFAVAFLIGVGGSAAAGSLHPMFVVATFAVTAVSVLGAIVAARYRQWWAVSFFVLGLVLVTSLVPLRQSPSHETLAYQWLEQSLNTSAQALLLVAAWLTTRAAARAGSPASPALAADDERESV